MKWKKHIWQAIFVVLEKLHSNTCFIVTQWLNNAYMHRGTALSLHWPESVMITLHWRHNEPDGVSNHQPRDCLLNCLFRCRRKHQSSASLAFVRRIHRGPVDSPHKKASNAENISIWWRHNVFVKWTTKSIFQRHLNKNKNSPSWNKHLEMSFAK